MLQGLIRDHGGATSIAHGRYAIAVIDDRHLVAECLARCLQNSRPLDQVVAYPSVIDWIASLHEEGDVALVILSIGGKAAEDPHVVSALTTLQETCPSVPVVLLADGEEARQILDALDLGVRGYIPTSVSLEVAVNAMILVGVGGTFIPASSLRSSCSSAQREGCAPIAGGAFTARQAAVIEALRKGKANKIIAYELNMRESTVKVHVRNIMKKLNAKNRTEVALIANSSIG
jgi:DNA-binding NarL/FixJ family response regulator